MIGVSLKHLGSVWNKEYEGKYEARKINEEKWKEDIKIGLNSMKFLHASDLFLFVPLLYKA